MATTLISTTVSTTSGAAVSLAPNNSLVVADTGVVAGLGASGTGVQLAGVGAVFNGGMIHGVSVGIAGGSGTGSRQVTNLGDGVITAGGTAIAIFFGESHRVVNHGEIASGVDGISLSGGFSSVRNTGTITTTSVAISFGEDSNLLVNTGAIFAGFAGIDATGNGNTVFNAGLIDVSGVGYARGILLGQSGSKVTNTGTIRADGGSASGAAIAFGFSTGDTGTEDNLVENFGSIIASGVGLAISGDDYTEIVRNSGIIVGGTALFEGSDLFDGTLGRQDVVNGGGGDDTLLGGAGADTLYGENDADSIAGGAGDDIIRGGAGLDTLEGGDGRDLLDYRGFEPVEVSLLLGTGSGGDAAGDVFSGFEWVTGGNAGDALTGDAGDNRLFGQGGADTLIGGVGADTLLGGDGGDVVLGGAGADVLTGGAGADRFRYAAASESAGAARDVISDFAAGDRLDLVLIDANAAGGSPNDAFAFIGAATFTAPGQVRTEIVGSNTYVYTNTDGNLATSEMVIVLRGAIVLSASDFIL